MMGVKREDSPETPLVAECLGPRLGLGEHLEAAAILAGRDQRAPEGEPEVDRLLVPLSAFRQMLERDERLLEVSRRLWKAERAAALAAASRR
jgi:hypothetical protein